MFRGSGDSVILTSLNFDCVSACFNREDYWDEIDVSVVNMYLY